MRNPDGLLRKAPLEWGRKSRKEEAHDRGARRRGRVENIEEQMNDYLDEVPLDGEVAA